MEKRISMDEATAVALKLVLRKTTIGQMQELHLEADEIKMLHDLLKTLERLT